jgi:hypothetical protein
MSYRILGIGVLQFTLVCFGSLWYNLKGHASIGDFVNYNFDTADKYMKDKKYVRATVYGVATPMILVGVLTLLLMIFSAIFFL